MQQCWGLLWFVARRRSMLHAAASAGVWHSQLCMPAVHQRRPRGGGKQERSPPGGWWHAEHSALLDTAASAKEHEPINWVASSW